jgi:hypothetical protein
MSRRLTADCFRKRSLLALPPDRPGVPFLLLGRWLCCPWARGTKVNDSMAAEIEAVRSQISAAGLTEHDAAWISEAGISRFRPVSSSWVQMRLHNSLTVAVAPIAGRVRSPTRSPAMAAA